MLALLFLGACSGGVDDPLGPSSEGPAVVATDAGAPLQDSAGITLPWGSAPAPDGLAAAQAASPITLPVPSGFVVTFVARECAAPSNVVSITSPVSQTLLTTACQAAIGQSWSFPGPFPAGTTIELSLQSTSGQSAARVSGAFPNWTVSFEDGFDNDFNDLVFTVTAQADTPDCPTAPAFQDPDVIDGLRDLWDQSNPDAAPAERVESGAWIIQTPAGFELVPIPNPNPDPCSFSPGEVGMPLGAVGKIHTHVFRRDEVVPPDICDKFPTGGEAQRGPGRADRETAQRINEAVGETINEYILDPEGILTYTVDDEGIIDSLSPSGSCGVVR
ncbi:MAG: hypothetical protein RQ745_06225 [Longimicrobiales bacterium]|nr:hypothetical protein [Longimicrobiales bacterium]